MSHPSHSLSLTLTFPDSLMCILRMCACALFALSGISTEQCVPNSTEQQYLFLPPILITGQTSCWEALHSVIHTENRRRRGGNRVGEKEQKERVVFRRKRGKLWKSYRWKNVAGACVGGRMYCMTWEVRRGGGVPSSKRWTALLLWLLYYNTTKEMTSHSRE